MSGDSGARKTVGSAALIPLRDVVLFPGSRRDLVVGRPRSVAALKAARDSGGLVLFVTQLSEQTHVPEQEDLYDVGCLAEILSETVGEDGAVKVSALGVQRARVLDIEYDEKKDLQLCRYEALEVDDDRSADEAQDVLRKLVASGKAEQSLFHRHADIPQLAADAPTLGRFLDSYVQAMKIDVSEIQNFLAMPSVATRVKMVIGKLSWEAKVSKKEKEIQRKAGDMSHEYRSDYLKEKAASIQKALGEPSEADGGDLGERVKNAGMSEEARTKCMEEIARLATITPMSPESSVIRTYIDVLLGLPWQERTEVNFDLKHARKILDEDHKGLDKIKERIIEYLAVQQLVGKSQGSVMCFLGPPGVGKTSLGQSIARATGRKFVRLALGGVHDEATIRGHRRTYVASMPGRILKAMADVKVRNPVFMLDEIDKLNASHSGDPMAALLEVVDPNQNHQFVDHYAEVEYDLSEVLFIATANTEETMYGALHDRLEFIELPGYTDSEKYEIAKRHLVPKQLEANGIPPGGVQFPENVLRDIIRNYTKEAGVRNLERRIAKVCRKVVLEQEIASAGKTPARRKSERLSKSRVRKLLGVPLNFPILKRTSQVGIVNGLAIYREWEGIVHQIDALRVPGGKGIRKTGKLKPNIEQTIDTAVTILRSHPQRYGLVPDAFEKDEIHIHYPNIDIAHDGNSNGLAVFALLVSVLNNIPVRTDTAMTGAINLRGEACAIGGLRTKLIGAWRERIDRVLIPHIQLRELSELPPEVVKDLEIIPVRNVDEMLRETLVRMPPKPDARKPVGKAAKHDSPPRLRH